MGRLLYSGRVARRVTALVAVLVVVLALAGGAGVAPAVAAPGRTVVVGTLLDLSAGWTTLGHASRATLRAATADANAALRQSGSTTRVVLRIADAQGTPEGAVVGLRQLARAGARVVVGPQSSSEAAATVDLAKKLGVLLVSQGSTAGRLAVSGDALLRLVPDDGVEVQATLAFAREDGLDALVPIGRDDIGNQGLVSALRAAGPARGLEVPGGVTYPTDALDLAAAVRDLSEQVQAAELREGHGEVGVYLAGFEETGEVLALAAGDPVLSIVPWYAGDGSAYVVSVPADPQSAAAAAKTGFAAATLGLDPAAEARARRLGERLGLATAPDAFALAAYDALRLGVLALERSPGGSLAAVRGAFVSATRTYSGLTGRIALNAAGDRTGGLFDMVGICPGAPGPRWATLASVSQALTVSDAADCPQALAQRVVRRFFHALQTRDRALLEAVLAPEFQLVRANGSVVDREAYLANPATLADYDFGPITATLGGAALVATYTVRVDSTIDGVVQPTDPAPRLSVLALHGGRWQLAAHANFNAISP